jgi:cell division septation protein DedD
VSAVETPQPPPPEAAEPRRCPRCGSQLSDGQEWCLECGSGVGTVVAPPPSWRGPVALVVVLLAIAAAALALALIELANDAEQVAEQPPATAAAPTPAPTAAPAPTISPTPESTTVPPTDETTGAQIQAWPPGQEGWTVVLESSATASAAQARATELAQQGIPVGILDSDDFGSLEPGRHVVFAGQFDSRRAADQGLANLSDRVEGAYVRRVAAE